MSAGENLYHRAASRVFLDFEFQQFRRMADTGFARMHFGCAQFFAV